MQSNCSTQRGMDRENSQSRKLNQNSFQPCREIKTEFRKKWMGFLIQVTKQRGRKR